MNDIFISYSQKDQAFVKNLATALESIGWTVFWDHTIPTGKTWQNYIGAALISARCVIVVWSKNSVTSDWVLEEANIGKRKNILFPILKDDIDPPLGFSSIQSAKFLNWRDSKNSPVFQKLVYDISLVLPIPESELGDSPVEKQFFKTSKQVEEITVADENNINPNKAQSIDSGKDSTSAQDKHFEIDTVDEVNMTSFYPLIKWIVVIITFLFAVFTILKSCSKLYDNRGYGDEPAKYKQGNLVAMSSFDVLKVFYSSDLSWSPILSPGLQTYLDNNYHYSFYDFESSCGLFVSDIGKYISYYCSLP